MSAKDKWIRRFSVDETAKHKNGFTIYKITSILFPIESPEAVTSVSVWKRYSDIQRLHKSMRSLHAGLHLRGSFPTLPRYNYFKRFHQDVIDERAKTIKCLLEFVAEHRLLFTSTDFVNFLQTGYPEPDKPGGVINTIRTSLHLPIEETPPLEYQTDDDDTTPTHTGHSSREAQSRDETDFISQIPIYEAADVEIRQTPKKLPKTESFESITSIDSIDSDLYEELNKLTVTKAKPSVRRMLPDLIIFDAPSTSQIDNYSDAGNTESENTSLCEGRSSSRLSLYSKRSVMSLSNVESKTRTEDSYVFEAGYMLSLAARCENVGDFQRAFECYKSGIEKMLIGVQTDTDAQRRALIKEKTNKYLSHAEEIYKNHLCDIVQSLLPEQDSSTRSIHCPIPLTMLQRPYEDLSLYRVLGVLGSTMMLVMHNADKTCYAMKVIQKVPNNLMEFDEYFLKRTSETRTPILPTVIPYMVPLQGFIETNNLIFLILSYAPGEKLLDYIKNYAKSMPNTPAREVNLENVFTEPKKYDAENNINESGKPHNDSGKLNNDSGKLNNESAKLNNDGGNLNNDDGNLNNGSGKLNNESGKAHNDNENIDNDNMNVAGVDELVLNSQKLLRNVDKVLSERVDEEMNDEENFEDDNVKVCVSPRPRDVIPPSAVCKWGAQILTALESLHNIGVICRDLNPKNILLGSCGQITLTYFLHYSGVEMSLYKIRASPGTYNMYIAPELYVNVLEDNENVTCDFWSYGAVMYELICGLPLSYYHRNIFTTHTILQLPDGLNVEEESLLTQLLTYDPTERLGGGKDGIQEIKTHPYFKTIDWQEVYNNWIVPD